MTESKRDRQTPEWPWFFLIFIFLLLLIGGIAAGIYSLFSQLTGVSNIWLLVCCAPPLILGGGFAIVYTLYARYGKPLRQIIKAIDSVAEGKLDVSVPEDSSPQFGTLIKRFNKMVGDLARADRQRRDLTADIAHELRTPLHIIQGKLEGMLDGVYQTTPPHLNDALDETKLLARLVDDLQTLSLAESGQLPMHPSRFLVKDLLQDAITSFAPQAEEKGVELASKVADLSAELTADYVRLNQVLANLVSNALRYTPKGGAISLEAGPVDGKIDSVLITVSDTGAGIAPEDLPFIFDRFWRGEKARTREGHANSGLGLAISRQLIVAHGGTIDAQSEVGKGTTFTIKLPRSPAA